MNYIQLTGGIIPEGTKVGFKPQETKFITPMDLPLDEILCALFTKGKEPIPNTEFEFEENKSCPELGIVDGVTTQELLILWEVSQSIENQHGYFQPDWIQEWWNEEDYAGLRKSLPAIWEDIKEMVTPNPKEIAFWGHKKRGYNPDKKNIYDWTMLTKWQAITWKDFESQIEELEDIEYRGSADIQDLNTKNTNEKNQESTKTIN